MSFKDHFSGHARTYAEARPDYPPALFAYLAGLCPRRVLAWDCATGSGQAAVAIAPYFQRVIASDGSADQLANARPADGVEYRVMLAEEPQLEPASVDLVTVAQALHWFDVERFFIAADRVLQADGILAVWSYGLQYIDAAIDGVLAHYYQDVVGPYWPPERSDVENGYARFRFPFSAVTAPSFSMAREWSLGQLLAYLQSWSATQRYRAEQGEDPLELIGAQLEEAWGAAPVRKVNWPLTLQVRRKQGSAR